MPLQTLAISKIVWTLSRVNFIIHLLAFKQVYFTLILRVKDLKQSLVNYVDNLDVITVENKNPFIIKTKSRENRIGGSLETKLCPFSLLAVYI